MYYTGDKVISIGIYLWSYLIFLLKGEAVDESLTKMKKNIYKDLWTQRWSFFIHIYTHIEVYIYLKLLN